MEQIDIGRHTKKALSRRTVVKGAAWSVPVITAAVAAPLAAASVTPPPAADYGQVTVNTKPKAGSNPTFSAAGLVTNGQDYDPGTVKAGELLTITFANGATAASYSALVGLSYVSGSTTAGPLVFQVTADTAGQVSVKLNNVQPVGGTITASILGGSGTSNISAP